MKEQTISAEKQMDTSRKREIAFGRVFLASGYEQADHLNSGSSDSIRSKQRA